MNNIFDRQFTIGKTNPFYEQAKIISDGIDLPIGWILKMAKEKGIQFLMNTYIEIKKPIQEREIRITCILPSTMLQWIV